MPVPVRKFSFMAIITPNELPSNRRIELNGWLNKVKSINYEIYLMNGAVNSELSQFNSIYISCLYYASTSLLAHRSQFIFRIRPVVHADYHMPWVWAACTHTLTHTHIFIHFASFHALCININYLYRQKNGHPRLVFRHHKPNTLRLLSWKHNRSFRTCNLMWPMWRRNWAATSTRAQSANKLEWNEQFAFSQIHQYHWSLHPNLVLSYWF